ncbi:unnamed protein product [Soboliphyme baturini]|uniref:Ricin B-type lectin domain-containing protein n=1 Tax=Soboliphyme baturini TaxID=241478 RepID=A0A183INK0_9BILA|nr:unnamed protein product [Soboliphyme baturini]
MKGNQEFEYNYKTQQLHHVVTNTCMEMTSDAMRLIMGSCDSSNINQKWVFSKFNKDKALKAGFKVD